MMRELDLKSLIVAAAIGAVALVALDFIFCSDSEPKQDAAIGAILGASVQVGLRLVGVS